MSNQTHDKRDPRLNPRAGDMVHGRSSDRVVLLISGRTITYKTINVIRPRKHIPEQSVTYLSSWRKWCATQKRGFHRAEEGRDAKA